MAILKEIWEPIKGYERLYEISNYGRVKSIPRNGTISREKILKYEKSKYGYLFVRLCKDGIRKGLTIHPLVWDHFGDKDRDSYKLQVDHINGDKTNNRIDNLQLLTPRTNTAKGHQQKGRNLPTGVYFRTDIDKYRSQIMVDYVPIHLGHFDTIEQASLAYQEALVIYAQN